METFFKKTEEISYTRLEIETKYLVNLHDFLQRNYLIATHREWEAKVALENAIERIIQKEYEDLVTRNWSEEGQPPIYAFKKFVEELVEEGRQEVAEAKEALREVASANEPQS